MQTGFGLNNDSTLSLGVVFGDCLIVVSTAHFEPGIEDLFTMNPFSCRRVSAPGWVVGRLSMLFK
jgi:hypothetical protein